MPASLAAGGAAESAPSTSGMTGPLSKRLRTLHSLQQQKQHVSADPKDDPEGFEKNESSASGAGFPLPSSSHRPPNHNHDHNNSSDDSDAGQVLKQF
jgi:hypothetical protein